ncbi:MAG: D-alanine--D-alanine ligase [Bacteroidaceae bacterium]|jgi:D-alanine-D-alanine ligase|nr:D-alanine--D-alanine ligase [Bacteroidaceae bacterium]
MKRIIAIVAGGDSSEHDVSLRSAQGIYSFMNKDLYECYITEIKGQSWTVNLEDGTQLPINREDFSFKKDGKTIRPDFAYITIHGTPGENGVIQGYFDLIGMPYSTSNVLVESLTFNKYFLNKFLKSFGVNVADSIIIRHGHEDEWSEEKIIERIGLPCFIKPSDDGSSFGVSKVNTKEQIRPAIEKAMAEDNNAMIEHFIDGREITCGCYKTKDVSRVFPITEVVSKNEFFDYDAKYNGAVEEITPARISEETARRVGKLTSEIYDILGCSGIIRIDYILTGNDGQESITLLEINTTPGMTATSFIPQQIRAAGLNIGDVLKDIIENKF